MSFLDIYVALDGETPFRVKTTFANLIKNEMIFAWRI